MAYQALYREWRPQRLSEVIGQRHVSQTLANAIRSGRVAQAYLFCGPRGTGKTTIARIIAKALNCVNGPTPEPCGECENCKNIAAGYAMDVIEIDAASNRGIDEIRDLRDKVRFAPAEGKYKVYIIDEVHMLTAEAFNALLKTLEEPPAHVVFILATTEPQRLPATILSRCQRFDFHRFSVDEIVQHLTRVCASTKLDVTADALALIARKADGGMRDALSLLDQTVAYATGKATVDDVLTVLGTTRDESLSEVARRIAAHDARGAIEAVTGFALEGRDLKQFTRDLLRYFRDLLMLRIASDPTGVVDAAETTLALLKADAALFDEAELLSVVETLATTDADLRQSTQPQLLLEVALIRLAHATTTATPHVAPASAPPATAHVPAAPAVATAPTAASATPPQPAAPADAPDMAAIQAAWPQVLEGVKKKRRSTHALLSEGSPTAVDGRTVTLVFKPGFAFHKDKIAESENSSIVQSVMSAVLGGHWQIRCAMADEQQTTAGGGEDPVVQGAIDLFGADLVKVRE